MNSALITGLLTNNQQSKNEGPDFFLLGKYSLRMRKTSLEVCFCTTII